MELQTWLIPAIWMAASATCPGSEDRPTVVSEELLDVCVYNYARLPAVVVDRALRRAAWVMERAGVRTRWHRCPQTKPACSIPRRADYVEVRILLSSRLHGGASSAQLGFAFQPVGGEPGTLANVLADRARQWAATYSIEETEILAHAIAHELGHLLLGAGYHAPYGLMAERWRTVELIQAQRGALCFSPGEAARIRARLHRARLSLQSSASVTGSHK